MMRLRFWTSCGRSVVSVGLTGVDIRQFGNSQWRGSHTAVFDRPAPRRDWPAFRELGQFPMCDSHESSRTADGNRKLSGTSRRLLYDERGWERGSDKALDGPQR